ncbi:MAG: 1-phosphofructokinase family hexose kinase [Promethearchaeota archaeon]
MKIIAFLLNPTIDQIFEINNFYVGGTFKVNESIIYPVGKAISFAIGIRELTDDNNIMKIIALIGREEISLYSNFIIKKGIDFKFIEVDGKTRSNKTINDPIRGTTTHIREKGFNVSSKELQFFIEATKNNVIPGDLCIFSGSLPPNLSDDIYFKLIMICKEIDALTVLDTSGRALINGVKANPHIIKPNLFELSQILNEPNLNELDFSDKIETSREIVRKAKVLLNNGLKIILITLGEKGAICLTNDTMLYGNVEIDDIVDTVGSGDAFLAGFILGYFHKKDLTECFKLAIACGAANTLISGPGIFNSKDVKRILKKVKIFNLI